MSGRMSGGAAEELRALVERGELIRPDDKYALEDWQHDAGCWIDACANSVLALIEAAQEMSELQSRSVVDLAEYDDATRSLAAAVSRLTEPQT